jgi:hypothetical protein
MGDGIELKRRSVQFNGEFCIFPLGESGSPSAINTFRNYRMRDSLQHEVGDEGPQSDIASLV